MTIVPFLSRVNDLIINPIILLLLALSIVYFMYSVIKFLSTDAGDKGSARIEARDSIMWSIVGMVIMISVYGIISFVLYTFGVNTSDIGEGAKFLK